MSELERTAMNRTEEAMEPLFTKTEIKGVDINLLYETPLQSFEMDEIPELKQSIRLPFVWMMMENAKFYRETADIVQ